MRNSKGWNGMEVGQVRGINSGGDIPVPECPELAVVDVLSVEDVLRCEPRDCTEDLDCYEKKQKNRYREE